MDRPCFLVVDREFPGSISTRKLVIETAKLNVLTAYSGAEAVGLLKRFPEVNGAVIDSGVGDVSTEDLVREIKQLQPKLPVIVISAPGFDECAEADYQLDSFQPAKLLEVLQKLQPRETAEIEKRNEDLSREQGGS